MEFKGNIKSNCAAFLFVLIESDWNLKTNTRFVFALMSSSVLIESDWNLKISVPVTPVSLAYRINRIRLEFKEFTDSGIKIWESVLIESDWNLKWENIDILPSGRIRINRIRLEFKAGCIIHDRYDYVVLIESDWNLKKIREWAEAEFEGVLIESDWNLKKFTHEIG